jgi:hypothetical protein
VIHLTRVSYTADLRDWLQGQPHYLENAPPGCIFAVGVWRGAPGLFEGHTQPVGPIQGLCLVSRPVARRLPQDGSVGEITRLYLRPGLPHGTASEVLRYAASVARQRGMGSLISYHDRSRHSGCIYRKAGFRKWGTVRERPGEWGSRPGRTSSDTPPGPKRRWLLELT